MSYVEHFAARRRERLARMSVRSPDALPPRVKPPALVIMLDKKGRRLPPPVIALPTEPNEPESAPPEPEPATETPPPPPIIPDSVRPNAVTIRQIEHVVADAFGVTVKEMRKRDRRPRVSTPRQAAMYATRRLKGWSLQRIGRLFGGYDHTSVLNGIRRTAVRMAADSEMAAKVEGVIAELWSSHAKV